MGDFQKQYGHQLAAVGPYLVTVCFFLVMILIRLLNPVWISGFTKNYLSVHIVLEFVGILVSFAIFTVGWATYQNARTLDILVLSLASFAVGALDLGHTLSFTGMPDFVGASGPNKAINFWFASRLTGSLAFLYIALSRPRYARMESLQRMLFATALIWVVFCYWAILAHPDQLPVFFVPGVGLQPSKVIIEWMFVGIASAAGVLLFVSAEKRENVNVRWMACASFLYGMCGYFFTIYKDFEDVYNFSGHIFKAISYLLLYRAVFVECVSKPYERVQQLAAEAEASNLSKSRFLANVSHEFRTPLGVIGGFGELLLNSGKLDTPQSTWAQTIVRNSKQLSLLIDDLLDLAKAETEKIEIRLSRFDVVSLITQVKQALEVQLRNSVEIKVDNRLHDTTWVVSDELRLRQILMNIVGNAVKFTSQGTIQISIQRADHHMIEICVQDTGIGIDSADSDRLFQPFSQVSNPNRRRFGGTGLGLSLSRKLAELLGGELYLKWSQLNVGSCFAILFNDHVATPDLMINKKQIQETAPAMMSFEGKRILIAEDSEDNQMLLNSYLGSTGMEIIFAGNGRKAVELVSANQQTHDFDLILMDIQMPEMDGFEATAELRRQGWSGHIVALTAHALQPERERAMKNGFNNYLVKPIKKETLLRAIAESFQ